MNLPAAARLRELWAQRSPRERQLAGGGGALLLVTLVYLLAWQPLARDLARLRSAVPRAHEGLAAMRAQAPLAKTLRGRVAPPAGALLPALEQSAAAHGLKPARLEPDGANGARLTFESVPFNAVLGWLAQLQQSQALQIDEAQFEVQATPGLVSVRLRLRAAGS